VIASAGVLENPDGYTGLIVFGTVTFVAAGLYWQSWRPGNPIGGVLIAVGFGVALMSLQGSGNPYAFAAGVLADIPVFLLVLYAVFAYPNGKLDTLGRAGLGIAAAYFALGYIPWLLTASAVHGTSPLALCAHSCPENVLQLASDPDLGDRMRELMLVERMVAVVVACTVLGLRLVRAREPRRRMLIPVVTLASLWFLLLGAYGLAQQLGGTDGRWAQNIGFGVTMARAMLPAAFLFAPIQARAFAGLALTRMLQRFEYAPTLVAHRRVMAQTLDDPDLRIALWLPQSRRYVDVAGREIEPPPPGSGRVWTRVDRGTEPVAALIHDEELSDDPELVDAAGHALVLATSSRRVEEELRRSVAELQRSRRLLLAADTAERRRLERELHATAQQHLVALRVGFELARERAETNSALADRLAGLGQELDRTVEELRRIAAGIYSPLLAEAGLRTALQDVARWAERPLRLELDEVGRLPAEVEDCVYVCAVEAIAHLVAHDGSGATTAVRLMRDERAVHFSVGEAGDGGAARNGDGGRSHNGDGSWLDGDGDGRLTLESARAAFDLQGIQERVAAVGGTVDIVSDPGRGIVVAGSIPIAGEDSR